MTFLQISSTATTARPPSSCPVTTRLIFSVIFLSPLLRKNHCPLCHAAARCDSCPHCLTA
jgi:hypothetical protein